MIYEFEAKYNKAWAKIEENNKAEGDLVLLNKLNRAQRPYGARLVF
jgi:hypothetical protein